TNQATTGDASGNYERQFSDNDRFTGTARHEFARFLVPNEQVQQSAGQRQHRSTVETIGTAAWQHVISTSSLADLSGMVRDDTVLLSSNSQSTPIIASQNRGFGEGYLQASLTQDWRRQEFKAGVQGDFLSLHEAFDDSITDPSQFDPGTPPVFSFYDRGRDREQALYVEDTARIGNWTIAPGIRWDNYSLLVHRSAISPRLAASRYFPRAALVAHVAYDRVFQTPAFENILLSSSPQVVSLDPQVLRKPVLPSNGNYYEAGLSKGLHNVLRVDASMYLRRFRNYADDNPLLDTSISFPIAFDRASIFGAEGKVNLPHWGILSGYASYSWMLGTCYLPVTGGLFLGDQATQALEQLSGRLWVSQDQRNTLRTRWIVHLPAQSWIASGVDYGSGLPVDFDGTRAEALAQYGATLVDRVNFARGRLDPSFSVEASAAKEWALGDSVKLRLQIDGENLSNRVNILDFAGLFSGNAVSPPRSGSASLHVDF
ncbi:MAG: TonB-dependent receptor, partial [Acidobacteriaceae bacterium]